MDRSSRVATPFCALVALGLLAVGQEPAPRPPAIPVERSSAAGETDPSPAGEPSAAETKPWRFAASSGAATIRAGEAGEWTFPASGEPLPAAGELIVAPGEPATLETTDARVSLAGESRATFDARTRTLTLVAGRALVRAEAASALRVAFADRIATGFDGSVAEIARANDEWRVTAARGGCRVEAASGDETRAVAPVAPQRLERSAKPADADAADAGDAPTPTPASAAEIAALLAAADSFAHDSRAGVLTILNGDRRPVGDLPVARLLVDAELTAGGAIVRYDQTFFNPLDRTVDGEYRFELPRGASIVRFAMHLAPDRLAEAEIVERAQATAIFDSIALRRRDAAILEQLADRSFRVRVSPINPGEYKRVLLDLAVRYDESDAGSLLRVPLATGAQPIDELTVSARVTHVADASRVHSPTHPDAEIGDRWAGGVRCVWTARDHRPASDFVLFVDRDANAPAPFGGVVSAIREPHPPAGAAAPASAVAPVAAPGGARPNQSATTEPPTPEPPLADALYFAASIPTDAAIPTRREPLDLLVIVDASSLKRDQFARRRERQTAAVLTLFDGLRDGDRIRVAAADAEPRWLQDDWRSPTAEERRGLREKLDAEYFLGELNLREALRAAAEALPAVEPGRRRMFVLVGEEFEHPRHAAGQSLSDLVEPFVGRAAPLCLLARRPGDAHRELTRLVDATGGVALADDPAGRRDLLRWARSGLPSPCRVIDLTVSGAEPSDVEAPAAILPGRPLAIAAQSEPRERVVVFGAFAPPNGEPRPFRAEARFAGPPDATAALLAGRRWAESRAERSTDDAALVRLAKRWNLVTRLTALLLLETEQDYQRWNVDRRRRNRFRAAPLAGNVERASPDWIASVGGPGRANEPTIAFDRIESMLAADRVGDAVEALKTIGRRHHTDPRFVELYRRAREAEAKSSGGSAARLVGRAFDVLALGRERDDFLRSLTTIPPSREWLARHPFAEKLMEEVDAAELTGLSLAQLETYLRKKLGDRVSFDWDRLDQDEALSSDATVPVAGITGRGPLRALLQHTLKPLRLVFVESPDRCVVTTQVEAETLLDARVYSVGDLLVVGRTASLSDLVNPYVDRYAAAERRLTAALRRPVTISFRPGDELKDVLESLTKDLPGAVVVDWDRMDQDEDLTPKTKLTEPVRFTDVELGDALDWLLPRFRMRKFVDRSALVLTTSVEAESRLTFHRFPVGDLLHEIRGDLFDASGGFSGGGMAGGGIGGGMAGGIGGGGIGGGIGGGAMGGSAGVGAPPAISGRATTDASAASSTLSGNENVDPPSSGSSFWIAGSRETAGGSTGGWMPPRPLPIWAEEPPRSLTSKDFVLFPEALLDAVYENTSPRDAWNDQGGPCVGEIFRPTLDLCVSVDAGTREQIERFLESLRRVPVDPMWGAAIRPARPRGAEARYERASNALFELLRLLQSQTTPRDSWSDQGGPGWLSAHVPQLALTIKQFAAVHEQIDAMLLSLRRGRWEAVHGTRPWEANVATRAVGAAALRLDPTIALAARANGQATEAELALLSARREPDDSVRAWNVTDAAGATIDRFTLRRAGPRLQFDSNRFTRRADDATGRGAVAAKGLEIAEVARCNEGVRAKLDELLPWRPHRTNAELATLFEVTAVERRADDPEHVARLRFAARPELGEGEFAAEFDRRDGSLIAWEGRLGDGATHRVTIAGGENGRVATLADGAGNVVLKFVEAKPAEDAAGPIDAPESWPELAVWDRDGAAADQSWGSVVEALGAGRDEAALQLATKLAERPAARPFLLSLAALAADRLATEPADITERLVALREALREAAPDAVEWTAGLTLRHAPAGTIVDVLSAAPLESRSLAARTRLVRESLRAERFEDALTRVAEASALAPAGSERLWELRLAEFEALLRLDRVDEARQRAVETLLEAPDAAARATLIERLDAAWPKPALAALAIDVARDDRLSRETRFRLATVAAAAAGDEGRAAELLPLAESEPDSPESRTLANALLASATTPRAVGELAKATTRADWRREFLLRRAALSAADESGPLYMKLAEEGPLPPAALAKAFRDLGEWEEHQTIVNLAEGELRRSGRLPREALLELRFAYATLKRTAEARRVFQELERLEREPDWTQGAAGSAGMGGAGAR